LMKNFSSINAVQSLVQQWAREIKQRAASEFGIALSGHLR